MKKQDNAIARIADMTFAVIVAIMKLREISPRLHANSRRKISDFGYLMRSLMINPIKKYEILDHDSIH